MSSPGRGLAAAALALAALAFDVPALQARGQGDCLCGHYNSSEDPSWCMRHMCPGGDHGGEYQSMCGANAALPDPGTGTSTDPAFMIFNAFMRAQQAGQERQRQSIQQVRQAAPALDAAARQKALEQERLIREAGEKGTRRRKQQLSELEDHLLGLEQKPAASSPGTAGQGFSQDSAPAKNLNKTEELELLGLDDSPGAAPSGPSADCLAALSEVRGSLDDFSSEARREGYRFAAVEVQETVLKAGVTMGIKEYEEHYDAAMSRLKRIAEGRKDLDRIRNCAGTQGCSMLELNKRINKEIKEWHEGLSKMGRKEAEERVNKAREFLTGYSRRLEASNRENLEQAASCLGSRP